MWRLEPQVLPPPPPPAELVPAPAPEPTPLPATGASSASVTLADGSVLKGTLSPDASIEMETIVGRVTIPFERISSISVEPRTASAGSLASTLLYHCTFDSIVAIAHPAVGPAGDYLGGEFVPGKKGNALRVFSDVPAAQTSFNSGDFGTSGTIEFWAKMDGAMMQPMYGDGGNPRFFCLWLQQDMNNPEANPRSSYLQWSGNDGLGRSGLCAMIQGTTATTEDGVGFRRYPAFLGNSAAWHHYAVVWDAAGVAGSSSVVEIYFDGERLPTSGHNNLAMGRNFNRFLTSSVLLGFPQRKHETEPAARHVPFLIDEFKIWRIAKTSFDLR